MEVTNRFKELDLIDRVPDELWIEQEAVIKTIPQEKEMQKAKVIEEALQKIAEKRREAKIKGKKEKYSHLNAEVQRERDESLPK